jgi:hypothetical protein
VEQVAATPGLEEGLDLARAPQRVVLAGEQKRVVGKVAAPEDRLDPREGRLEQAETSPVALDPGHPDDVVAAAQAVLHDREGLVVREGIHVHVEADVALVEAAHQARELLGRRMRADQVVDPHVALAAGAGATIPSSDW